MTSNKVNKLQRFMDHKPYELARYGAYTLYEHPLKGDEAPIYMTTPTKDLINTGFYDLGDFDLSLCVELDINKDSL